MTDSEFIIDVSEETFNEEVLHYSQSLPVLVAFWAVWSVPCRVLAATLEKVVAENSGMFRLARLNVDENPKLAERFNIRSLPHVKAFINGNIAAEFSGNISEAIIQEFLHRVIPSETDLLLEKGKSLLAQCDYSGAELVFNQYLDEVPNHPEALLGLIKANLWLGEADLALQLLSLFPPSREYSTAQLLIPVAQVFADVDALADAQSAPLVITYQRGVRLAMRGNVPAALDGFLDILREDKNFRKGELKALFIGLLTLLGDDFEDARQYRNDLASVLF